MRERLTLYLDHELQGEELTAFEFHVLNCDECRSLVEKEQLFLNSVRTAGPLNVAPPELRSRVEDLLLRKESEPVATKTQPKQTRTKLTWGLAIAAAVLVITLPLIAWRVLQRSNGPRIGQPSSFALMSADTHLRRTRGQLPLEMESGTPGQISNWFSNKVNFSVKLPNYQDSSGQEKLYTLEGARLVGFKEDYAAYVAYRMKARPISLVITSASVAQPSGGEEITAKGLKFHYDAIQGLKVLTWSDRGLTYALVSDFEERGQQSCIVCHQGANDRDFIDPLKPHH